MRMNKIAGLLFASLLFVAAFLVSLSAQAQSASPQETLNQYVADLQKTPNDKALWEKIIALALTMNPAPAIPEEARRHYIKAIALSEDGKQPSDFADAAEEFRQALLIAPWWGEAYKKMGLALEAAQHYDNAIAWLKLFMATKPQDDALRDVQDEIYKIEAKEEKAAKETAESSSEAIAAKKQKEFDAFLAKIDGRRYVYIIRAQSANVIDIRGKFFVFGLLNATDLDGLHPGYQKWLGFPGPNPAAIQGIETVVQLDSSTVSFHPVTATFIISADGNSITRRTLLSDGTTADNVFLWQR